MSEGFCLQRLPRRCAVRKLCRESSSEDLDELGRKQFYQRRIAAAAAANHHNAIDSTLKQANSRVNALSACSGKARVRDCSEVSVLYTYDIERMEPICAEVFPGNSIDTGSYPAFIRDNNIRKGIIAADKGFPPGRIKAELSKRPDLHFLTPIKRNEVRIRDNNMLSFEGVPAGIERYEVHRKKQIRGGRYLYAFNDAGKASDEEASYLANAEKKGLSPGRVMQRKKRSSALLPSNPTRILRPGLRISALRTDGSWNWYLADRKVMYVWTIPMCRVTFWQSEENSSTLYQQL